MYDNSLIENIRSSSRLMIKELGFLNYEKEYLGLSPSQVHALIEIEAQGYMTNFKLAEFLNLDKSTISRLVKNLFNKNLVIIIDNPDDERSKLFKCSKEGINIVNQINSKAKAQVIKALNFMNEDEFNNLEKSLNLYSKALSQVKKASQYNIRLIKLQDNLSIEILIKNILAEFEINKASFAFADESLSKMYEFYSQEKRAYFIIEKDNKIYGGAGIAKLEGKENNICELQKMYLSKEIRDLGLASELMNKILLKAKDLNYQFCYLEIIENMKGANKIYQKFGFTQLDQPIGNTGQHAYFKELL